MASVQTQVELLKSSITSPSSCTPATLATLNELLFPHSSGKVQTKTNASSTSVISTLSLQPKTKKSSRTGLKTIQVNRQENSKLCGTELSPKEKAVLATEVINGTLAALSIQTKSQSALQCQPSPANVRKSSARKIMRRSNSLSQSPLRAQNFERVSSSPDVDSRPGRPSFSVPIVQSKYRTMAECSRVAFACLQELQALKAPCLMDLKPNQLENGMVALIGRLIPLGLDDLALRELRILKSRLDTALKATESTTKKTGQSKSAKALNVGSQTLAEIIDFETPPSGGILLSLAIAVQMNALKLIASSKKPGLITSVVSKLQEEYPSSPIQLLLRSAKESPAQTAKAAKQLDNLSRLIFSFTPSVSSSEDIAALSPTLNPSPEIVLKLQVLGFHCRTLCWKLRTNQPDIEKELLDPFSRCLAGFARRSQIEAVGRYERASGAFQSIQNMVLQCYNGVLEDGISPLIRIYKLLGSLAQDAAQLGDAIKWMEIVEKFYSGADVSDVQRWTTTASLLSLKLLILPLDENVESLLVTMLKALEGPLNGGNLELDEFFSEVSRARRTAITILCNERRPDGKGSDLLPDGIRQMCESLVLLCPRFCVRYLAKPSNLNASTKIIIRYEQRRQFVAKSASNIIDSALFLIKVFQSENRLTWELIDSTLKSCVALLESAQTNSSEPLEEPGGDHNISSSLIRISNLYFNQHLNMKRSADDPKDIQHLRPLRMSIECVQTRPAMERKAALINLKLERIADIYKSLGRLDDARCALVSLRDGLVEIGVLSSVAAASNSQPLHMSWSQSGDASMLARTIGQLLKLELHQEPKSVRLPYTGMNCSVEEKGVILEHSLNVLSKRSKDTLRLQKAIFRELLVIYDQTSFPIRRLRVVTYLLRLAPEHRRDLAVDVRNTLAVSGLESIVGESKDIGLRSYLPHLRALTSSILELQEEHPRIALLKPHLIVWRSILDECADYKSFTVKVDEIHDLLNHLHSIADFLFMKGLGWTRIAVLKIIAGINEFSRPAFCPDDAILSYVALGQQYLELGYSGKAGASFDRALSYASSNEVSTELLLRARLSYAEYLLAIGNADKCEEVLSQAETIVANNPDTSIISDSTTTLSDRIRINRLFAEASHIYSLLNLERGFSETALKYARRNVRLIRRAWNIMELQLKAKDIDSRKGQVESIVEDFSSLSVSAIKSPVSYCTSEKAPSSSVWALVGPLFRGLSQLSKIYAFHGMFRETVYYAEQAYKLVKDLDSKVYSAWALAITGHAWLNAGTLKNATELLTQAKELGLSSGESYISVVISCYLGKLYRLLENPEAESEAYDEAQKQLETLMSIRYINNLDQILDPTTTLEEEMCRLSLKINKPRNTRNTATKKKATSARTPAPVAKTSTEICSPTFTECFQLVSLRGLLFRQKASAYMLWKRCDEATNALKEARACSTSLVDSVDQHISFAKQILLQSVEKMSADPVFGVLQDSTISFPAVANFARSGSDKASGVHLSPRAKTQANGSGRVNRARSPCSPEFFDKLRQAQDHLTEAHSIALQVSSTPVIQNLLSLLTTITIFLSAGMSTKGSSYVHPSLATWSAEIARNISIQRERKAILADMDGSSQKDGDLQWPAKPISDLRMSGNGLPHDMLRFQKDYIDIIPPTWTAISMSLCENEQALYLTKMQASRTPFTLRLPIARNNSRDVDEEVFDFGQGKAELCEIISLANYSAHSAREISAREAKKAWWEERESLDKRLKDLLENIENVWLGGFKGIFSQQQRQPGLLAQFQISFQNILNKHLPSRQKTRRRNKVTPVTLDAQILELFLGLVDGCRDDCDVDDALTDLLYFVVDVLQFHGERNAYDEIDFDSIVVETQDALRCYCEAAHAASAANEERHTILILDKALHAFPWESLPCMEGLAISRLPSLDCLRERLLDHKRPISGDPKGHYVDRDSGTYVLNPGGDLKTTQVTFESNLKSLDNWSGIINSEPSEAEVKVSLLTKDLYLYFGHGSGSQYIRAKTIKSLEKCAVTILMGCSSGALNDVGEFQPYGPPMDYMLGGCPALVATLWDVTDKDIDRFAESMFERWGLFGPEKVGDGQTAKGSENGTKKLQEGSNTKETSLVEAVALARKACNFRYLTAASVCVYGIPVYMK